MKHGFLTRFALPCAAAAMAFSGAAVAQTAGTWMLKGGYNNITPQVSSGDLSPPSLPGSKVDVKSASAVIGSLTYMLRDDVSLELFAGLPYKHDVVGDGALAGFGKLGTVKQVSPTIIAQYRFMPAAASLRPYVGLGLTYAYFYGEEGSGTLTALTKPGGPPTKLSASSAFGVSPQLGLTIKIDGRWFIDAAVIKTYVKSTTTLSTGQSIDVKLDPLSTNIAVGYRF